MDLSCFKAYDIRGRAGTELSGELAFLVGRAYVQVFSPRLVAVGGDSRLESPALKAALAEGLAGAGCDVLDLGLVGTEEVYHAVFSQKLDGGLMVTGSHNPVTDNGIKFVGREARPISGESGLFAIRDLIQKGAWQTPPPKGLIKRASFRPEYIDHLLGYIKPAELSPFRIVANAGNGAAGPLLNLLEAALCEAGAPLSFIKINNEPDGTFPNGLPNPLLPGNRRQTAEAVRRHKADLGLAWDGDFDRCFFFDENGGFIEGYYIVGLLAEMILAENPGAAIIHDPRLTWNTVETVKRAGGRPVESKTGHAFIKESMRAEKAVYGGEMSAHHYFARFSYCDSGMIPWLLILALLSRKNSPLSKLTEDAQAAFPCSGEINYKVPGAESIMAAIEKTLGSGALRKSRRDGLSLEFPAWRFNLRASNTEALLRLNLETRGDKKAIPELVSRLEAFTGAKRHGGT